MEVDYNLKQQLLGKLSNYYPSMPVYSIRKMSEPEKEERAKYYATQFMRGRSIEPFKSHKRNHSKLFSLPWNTSMEIFDDSDAVFIKQQLKSFEHMFNNKPNLEQLTEMVNDSMKKLQLDKYRLPIEYVELETIWQTKKSGITIKGDPLPVFLSRVTGIFKRYINNVPVFGGSIYIRIAEGNIVESIGVEWRPIEEKPKAEVKIISPEAGANKILNGLASISSGKKVSIDDFEPESFDLGYYSKPKRQEQKYMQPVYAALFKPRSTDTNCFIVIPASNAVYETYELTG